MTPEEIRKIDFQVWHTEDILDAQFKVLREIAAQLAEISQNLKPSEYVGKLGAGR